MTLPPLPSSRSLSARRPLASGPGMTVSPSRRHDLGVVPPGRADAVGDADQRSGHRLVRRNAGQFAGRQVCITWMRAYDTTVKAGTFNSQGGIRRSTPKTWVCSSAWTSAGAPITGTG